MPLSEMVIMPGADYQDACDAVREKTGGTGTIVSGQLGTQIRSIAGENLDEEISAQDGLIDQITAALAGKGAGAVETWTFEMEDGSTVTKDVVVS